METRIPLQRAVPAARTIDLVTTHSHDKVLVYDQAAHHIHHLNALRQPSGGSATAGAAVSGHQRSLGTR